MITKLYLAALATHTVAASWSLPQWLSRRTVEKRAAFVAEQIIYVPTDVYEGDNFFEYDDALLLSAATKLTCASSQAVRFLQRSRSNRVRDYSHFTAKRRDID